MRVVTRVTGLVADTIRAWERRYGAIVPHRTAGNARRYSAAHVRKLSLLRDLTERGHSIGSIASLTIDQLESLLAAETSDVRVGASATDDPLARARADYLSAVTRMDVGRASEILLRAAAVLDNRSLVFDLVLPLIQEVGERWSHGDLGVAQEHLVSAELRSLLAVRARIHPPDATAPRMVVATPAGHRHEFGVLAAAMLANGRGIDVLYLGADLPDEELLWSVGVSQADVLVLGVAVVPGGAELDALRWTLNLLARSIEVWFGCPPEVDLEGVLDNVRVFHSFEEFDIAASMLGR